MLDAIGVISSHKDTMTNRLITSKPYHGLSNVRQRELDRLNQIEHTRRMLDLKSQNDLLDQMSISLSSRAQEVDLATKHSDPIEPVTGSDFESNGVLDGLPRSELNCKSSVQRLSEGSYEPSTDVSSKPEAKKPTNASKIENLESLDDNRELNDYVSNILDSEHQPHNESIPLEDSGPVDAKQSQSSEETISAKSDEILRKPITADQIEQFVSACVPENKRVLCVIVRDKTLRLSRTKSYFYPTYYLFIQTIVDINDNHINDQMSLYNCASSRLSEEADGVIEAGGNNDSASADNSFSASSSISADMMIIGPNDESILTKTTGTTSYSGDEDGNHKTSPLKANASKPQTNVADSTRDSTNEARRDSPLVFPDSTANTSRLDNLGNSAEARSGSLSKRLVSFERGIDDHIDQNQASKARSSPVVSREKLERPARLAQNPIRFASTENNLDEEEPEDNDSDNEEEKNSIKPCRIVRGAERLSDPSEVLDLFQNDENPFIGASAVLLAGKRRKKTKTYLIGPNEYGYTRKNCICKLKSNVLGTQFTAIRLNQAEDNNDRCTVASIGYETNVLGFKGPRKMRVFLAKEPSSDLKNLTDAYKRDPGTVIQLKNLTPAWNVESQSYVLNFHGRVTQASVKNFQLVQTDESPSVQRSGSATKQTSWMTSSANNGSAAKGSNLSDNNNTSSSNNNNNNNNPSDASHVGGQSGDLRLPPVGGSKSIPLYNSSIVMQFGRISEQEFTCDVTYPLSILQAFAIALSSFDSKLACE